MTDTPISTQAQVLEAFTFLHTLSPEWGGCLILNAFLDASGAAMSLASSVAGAVCLTLEPDPEILRAAIRRGACDFVVNTLDEALRAIKNEVRQRKPLAVGLQGDPVRVLEEILERGVAPCLFAAGERFPESASRFGEYGTESVSLHSPAWMRPANQEVSGSPRPSWDVVNCAFRSNAELRDFEVRALATLPFTDTLRRQWLSAAGRLFPRERNRVLWLSDQERVELMAMKR